MQRVYDYFAGGREVVLPREGYEETLLVPGCGPGHVDAAVEQAAEQGLVWLTNGPASILSEPVPAGVLSAAVPSDDKLGDGRRQPNAGTRPGVLTAEAVLEANGIQDLADQVPAIARAAVGNDLKFTVRVEFGADETPPADAVE